jgi:CheY-like chemotaxis protein
MVLVFPGKVKECVLLVENNWRDLVLMSYVLDEEGLRGCVHGARTGQEALSFLNHVQHVGTPKIKALITALSLPDMHGSELVDAIRHDPLFKHIPIIVFSGSTLGLTPEQRKLLATAKVIEKPVAFSEFQNTFISLLRSVLQKPRPDQIRA